MQRFRGGLVFQAPRLCASLDSRLDSNTEEKEDDIGSVWQVRLPRRQGAVGGVATSGVPILVSQGAEVIPHLE